MSSAPITSTVLDLLGQARRHELELVAGAGGAELEPGTPERWSARDLVIHVMSWRRRQTEKLAAAERGGPLPSYTDMTLIDRLNAHTFEAFRLRPWAEVREEAERAYADLVAQVERTGEAALIAWGEDGQALWPETLGNGAWHVYTHLEAFHKVRGDTAAARRIGDARIAGQEQAAQLVAEVGGPVGGMRAAMLYDLACLYALAGRVPDALGVLAQALALKPRLVRWAQHDGDLETLRGDPTFAQLVREHAPSEEAALITATALRELQQSGRGPLVIDVRDAEEYAAGHLAGAVNIPRDSLERRLADVPRERPVVTYCNMRHAGISRGEQAAELLRERGYDARALDGGFPRWQGADLPVEAAVSVSRQ